MSAIDQKENNWVSPIDPNKCLPPELTVQSVEHILHRIGLTLDSTKSYPKRKLFFNPIIIFSFFVLFNIREVIIISMTEENDLTLKILGSIGYLMGIRVLLSIFFILYSSLQMCFQLIYYYNYRNGIKPTFLRVFQMMSGLVSPKSIGLTDEHHIQKLLKLTKPLIKCLKMNNIVIPLCGSNVILFTYVFEATLLEAIYYGLPNSIIMFIYLYYAANFVFYQFFVFFILCLYLKLKINSLNERLLEMKERKRFIRIRETLQSFDSLYSEINEYNTTFWSKILFSFWALLGTVNVFATYICLLSKLEFINKVIFGYTVFFFMCFFLFIIFTASSVTYCANKSYKTLNSLIISYSKHNKHKYFTRTSTKLKVLIKLLIIILTNFP